MELVSSFLDESRESQMYNLKKKTDKTPLIQFQVFVFYKTRLFTEKYFHGRALSIRAFSADEHCGLIVPLRG